MESFVFQGLPARVVFGPGSLASLSVELERLGMQRALILTTPEQQAMGEDIARRIGAHAAGVFPGAVMHVPKDVAEQACEYARSVQADGCIAIGGGSTIGLAKAVALAARLPIVAIPTTYAGSEMTSIWGMTENGVKVTGRDAIVQPRTVIYEPALTYTLPAELTACSGMNAMAHALEALYAADTNPIISLMAIESVRALAKALPRLAQDIADAQARADALYGAWLAGVSLASTTMALHHKLCHTLGGSFNLPHAQSHAIVLPYTMQFNASSAAMALAPAAQALGGQHAEDIGRLLFDLNRRLGITSTLGDIGFPEDGPARAAQIACANPYKNPRTFTEGYLRTLLEHARAGRPPA